MPWGRAVLGLASVAAAIVSVVGFATNPLVLPFARLGAAEARVALERTVAREVDADWLRPRLEAAIGEDDADRAAILLELAEDHGVQISDELRDRTETLVSTGIRGCGACAFDVTNCRTVSQIATCALPIELTPLGDLNALRRQGMNWAAGTEVDRVETGLALAGLAGTGAVLVSAGSGAVVKVGTTLARVARRAGRLTPGFSRTLADAADIPVAWNRLGDLATGRAALSDVTDAARLARLQDLGRDAGRLYANTSAADTFALLRHVEGADDLARLANLSEVAAEATRPAVEALGLARAIRATTRVTDLVLAALGVLAALLTQVAGFLVSLALRSVGRRLDSG